MITQTQIGISITLRFLTFEDIQPVRIAGCSGFYLCQPFTMVADIVAHGPHLNPDIIYARYQTVEFGLGDGICRRIRAGVLAGVEEQTHQ